MTESGQYEVSDLVAIKKAIATGAKEVWYGEKRLVYNSTQEMIAIKNMIEKELAPPGGGSGRRYGYFVKD